jgi:hypothetical protein
MKHCQILPTWSDPAVYDPICRLSSAPASFSISCWREGGSLAAALHGSGQGGDELWSPDSRPTFADGRQQGRHLLFRESELKDLIDLDIRQMHLDCCGTAQLIIDGLW